MNIQPLKVAKVSNRGNKFAIVCGAAILQKFKTAELAKQSLEQMPKHYAYWAQSISVSYQNSPKVWIIVS